MANQSDASDFSEGDSASDAVEGELVYDDRPLSNASAAKKATTKEGCTKVRRKSATTRCARRGRIPGTDGKSTERRRYVRQLATFSKRLAEFSERTGARVFAMVAPPDRATLYSGELEHVASPGIDTAGVFNDPSMAEAFVRLRWRLKPGSAVEDAIRARGGDMPCTTTK